MALTLTQKPTTPNASRTNLLYTLTSDSSSKDQFRYIAQISTDEIDVNQTLDYPDVTLKYYPNTTGSGIIDLANVFNRYLAWDENSMAWSTSPTNPIPSSGQSTIQIFSCSFGEEFADSPSSSLQTYTGSIIETIQIFQGKVDIESGDYNFNTASLKTNNNNIFSDMPDVIYDINEYDFLRECPKADYGDYQTLTLLNQSNYEINVCAEAIDHYTGSSLLTITGSTASEDISTVGVGPFNILNSSIPDRGLLSGSAAAWLTFKQTSPTAYKSVNFMLPNHSLYPCNKVTRVSLNPSVKTTETEYVRFIWQNNYGMWDFYNVYNILQQVDRIDRESYTQPQPTYNQTTSPFNINNRGEKQISSILTEQFTISTDYVSDKTSNWLTQMFDSNNVYMYIPPSTLASIGLTYLNTEYGNDLRAIIINDVNYRWQENNKRNKTFQYNINWSFANKSFVY